MAAEGGIDSRILDYYFPRSRPFMKRTMVEVGAAGPDYLSVGARFRDAGWRVISVEPNPQFAEAHRKLGNEIYEFAASDRDADDVDFQIVDLDGAEYEGGEISYESISSLGVTDQFQKQLDSLSHRATVRNIKVKTRRLDTIFASSISPVERIDLLCIDVEGWEMTVLDGLSSESPMPSVVLLENYFDNEAYRVRLNTMGYTLMECIVPNEVYVSRLEAGKL